MSLANCWRKSIVLLAIRQLAFADANDSAPGTVYDSKKTHPWTFLVSLANCWRKSVVLLAIRQLAFAAQMTVLQALFMILKKSIPGLF